MKVIDEIRHMLRLSHNTDGLCRGIEDGYSSGIGQKRQKLSETRKVIEA